MTEMFGDPKDFAIEAGVEPNLRPPSAVWGHMRVWCCGNFLGDIEERNCALFPSFQSFHWLATHINELWDDSLEGLDDMQSWNLLDGALYGYHGDVELEDNRTLEEMRRDERRYCGFDFLTNWGEQFDGGFKSFILCPPPGPIRILSRAFPRSVGLGVDVSKEGFMTTLDAFVAWFKAQERRLQS